MDCLSDDGVVDYLEDRVGAAEVTEIAAHLDGCGPCRSLVVTLARSGLARPAALTGDATATPIPQLLHEGSLLGRYRVLDLLGAGGMGVVYSAEDTELNRRVALKLLHAGTVDPRGVLLREAQALARVSHPNVVTVFEVGTFEDRVFVAMELVAGWTLREWLGSAKRAFSDVLAACLQAGRGVAAAHDAGLVHRDLKPDNILIGDDGRVRVTDFGLALGAGGTGDKMIAGTLAYMAPEQRARGETDARSDQYAFCVVMREALGASAPGWVAKVLARGLAGNPADRFPSMHALLTALERAPIRRRRFLLAAGVASAALAVWALQTPPCGEPADLYPPQRAAALRATFVATGKPFAAAAFAEVDRVLTAWLAHWNASTVDSCEATHVRHVQSGELMDLRNECLRRSLAQTQALVALFEKADAKLVERAGTAVHGLPELSLCDDGAALRAGPKQPADRKLRDALAPLQTRLALVAAQRMAGKYKDALAELDLLIADARATQHMPLIAEALYWRGDVRDLAGQPTEGRADLNEAIRVAEGAGDDLLKGKAWVRLVYAENNPARLADGKQAVAMAEATLRRIGGGGSLAVSLASARANLDLIEGNNDAAITHVRQAISLQDALGEPKGPRMSSVLVQLGNVLVATGDYHGAHAAFLRACDLDEKMNGRDHPRVAGCSNSLSASFSQLGEFEQARMYGARAVELRAAHLGPEHLMTYSAWCNLGEAQRGLGRHLEALASFATALKAEATHGVDNVVVASAENGIGMTLLAMGKLTEAEPHLLRSLSLNEKLYGKDHVELAWLTADLADLKLRQGKPVEALAFAQSSLEVRKAKLDANHPELARSLQMWGEAQLALGKPELARGPLERAVAICIDRRLAPQQLAESQAALARTLAAFRPASSPHGAKSPASRRPMP